VPVEVKVDGAGKLPEYASDGAAGADLRAAESVVLSPGGRAAVATGLHMEIPPDHVGLVWPLAATSRGEGGFGSTGR
jgi:dUTP pyrophosphatase